MREYYRWVPPEDLVGRDALDLYGAALAHWKFLEQRAPGEAKVRVYNPSFEQHGWQSTHTVVEMATDDMPFLVDSVTMALTRRSHGIHLLLHPVVRARRDEASDHRGREEGHLRQREASAACGRGRTAGAFAQYSRSGLDARRPA